MESFTLAYSLVSRRTGAKVKTLLLKPTDTTSVFQWEEHSAIQRAAGSLSCSTINFCICKVGLIALPTFPRLL